MQIRYDLKVCQLHQLQHSPPTYLLSREPVVVYEYAAPAIAPITPPIIH